ncbi:hypothetical protein Egran_02381 [Elaphomyces granulatus]|uniref:S-adenosyl-L-methionine-dependent tRNA 4-demethylwyosine synthase n=1 Tax=Elaphomyces granulatus TaxID=519963 RepID=A0A232M0D2_9EURO|nr:hypothetical protein Egran_02381 [Elaphomyces granulatus]
MSADSTAVEAQGLLAFWHSFRIPILVAGTALLIVLHVYHRFHWRLRVPSSSEPSLSGFKAWPQEDPEGKRGIGVSSEKADSGSPLGVRITNKSTPGPKRVVGKQQWQKRTDHEGQRRDAASTSWIKPLIFFTSLTGSTEKFARGLGEELRSAAQEQSKGSERGGILPPEIHDLSYIDFDEYFIATPPPPPNTRHVYCFLIPTYNIDTIINTFLHHLNETHHDFRIDTAPLSSLAGYSVFGFGDREGWPTEEEGFCSQARELDRWMAKLTGRKRAYPLGVGDVKSDAQAALKEWSGGLLDILDEIAVTGGLGEGVVGSGDPLETDDEADDDGDSADSKTNIRSRGKKDSQTVIDLEDIQATLDNESLSGRKGLAPLPVDFTTPGKSPVQSMPSDLKEMVPKTSPTYSALTKQGYTIVGSHSGVKICRWTKSALRGRGSCYKYSFYGIRSHLCMETTPSLSCSNKCVFCWRHGTNPVGTTWRWKVDPPEMIFQGAKEGHYKKIKMLRGVPGVRAERFAEAMRIRHCALSLVGEPIFYPRINEFVSLLHGEGISSFLVCNAQHPEQLAALDRVTQLYVSIDASNRESLRRIDRPLHRDFWERFQRCLDIMREKRLIQRTVFRLTLVKGFNVEDEAVGYADLVEKALPGFVEVKGVTYCGTSSSAGAGLTMQNVPFYEEVAAFVVALGHELQRRGLKYGIAAEHAHSCCILIASERFLVNGRWHTRIDYDRFFELLEKEKTDGIPFRPEDYTKETEPWALWGNGGFDPSDQRVYKKGRNKAPAMKTDTLA